MNNINAFRPLTKDDIADVLGVSPRTIENWVNDGTLPVPKKVGNRVYWHPNAFYTWLDHCLTVDAAAASTGADVPILPQPAPQKGAARTQGKATKTEADRLRNRTQAKLEVMLA